MNTLILLINLINNISIINLYLFYIRNPQLKHLNTDITLDNLFFGSVKLIKNVDLDKYKSSGYRIGIDSRSEFSFTDGRFGKKSLFLEVI